MQGSNKITINSLWNVPKASYRRLLLQQCSTHYGLFLLVKASFTGDLEMKTKLIIKVKTVMLEAIEEYNLSN